MKVEAVDYTERVIYHSPEKPGHTSWVGLWPTLDGRVRCAFRQLTGPKENPATTVPMLETRDGGTTWTRAGVEPPADPLVAKDTFRCAVALPPDGTLVRGVWGSTDEKDTSNDTGFIVRSTDAGKTWGERIHFMPVREYRAWPTLMRPLRDGRLVLFAGCWKRGDRKTRMTKMMFLSSDQGSTWSPPIVLMPPEVGVCEESDFCELPNGDLFWVHRTEHYPPEVDDPSKYNLSLSLISDRMQSIARKQGETFVAGQCEKAALPHSGFPALLRTPDGIILHLATDGMNWTADLGKTWTRLNVPGSGYYPKALQLADGSILCLGHRGGDDQYGTVDQHIWQQTFRLRVTRED